MVLHSSADVKTDSEQQFSRILICDVTTAVQRLKFLIAINLMIKKIDLS